MDNVLITVLNHCSVSGKVSFENLDCFISDCQKLFAEIGQDFIVSRMENALWKFKDNENDYCILSSEQELLECRRIANNRVIEVLIDISKSTEKPDNGLKSEVAMCPVVEKEWNNSLVFYINGKMYNVANPDPSMKLVTFIRDVANLKGTKIGCYEAGCGACTTLLSWNDPQTSKEVHVAVNSCSYPLCAVDGKHITTVEGVGNKENMHPIQKALSDGGGTQCGFCTPGFVMSMYEMLKNNPNPSEEDIEKYFDGNLCRCTGYRGILESLKSMAGSGELAKIAEAEQPAEEKEVCRTDCGDNCACKSEGKFDLEEIFSLYAAPQPTSAITKSNDVGTSKKQTGILPAALKFYSPSPLKFVSESNGSVWLRPTSLVQLKTIQENYKGRNIRFIVGNTSAGVDQFYSKNSWVTYDAYVDIRSIPEFTVQQVNTNGVLVGSSVSLSALMGLLKQGSNVETKGEFESIYDVVRRCLRSVATMQVRNVASWAGNVMLAWKYPQFGSDLVSILSAISAKVKYYCNGHIGTASLDELLSKSSDNVILLSLYIPSTAYVQQSGCKLITSYYRTARRAQNSHAIVNGAFMAQVDASGSVKDCKICYVGATDGIMRAYYTEAALKNKAINTNALQDALVAVQKDFNAAGSSSRFDFSPEYRLSLVKSFLYRYFCYCMGETGTEETKLLANPIERPISKGSQIMHPEPKEKPLSYPEKKLSSDIQTTGEAKYNQDLPQPPNTAVAVFVRCHSGMGTIKSIDVSQASKIDGFVDVITAADIPGNNVGGCTPDEPVLVPVGGKIEFYGQAYAVVVAENMEAAEYISSTVKCTLINPITPITSMDEAIRKKHFMPGDRLDNVTKGDVATGFKNAYKVITGTVSSGLQKHFYMEPNNAITIPKEDGTLDVWCANQDLWFTQNSIAQNLKIPMYEVNCCMTRAGGAFGAKINRHVRIATASALAAKRTGRPVNMSYWRQEDTDVVGARQPMRLVYKAGLDKTGKLTACQFHFFLDAGFAVNSNLGCLSLCPAYCDNTYFCENWLVSMDLCKTNQPTNASFRGPVMITVPAQMEVVMEHAANAMNMDPVAIRGVNLYKPGQESIVGSKMWPKMTLDRLYNEGLNSMKYKEIKQNVDEWNTKNKFMKRGLGVSMLKYSMASVTRQSTAQLKIYPQDGSVLICHNGSELGQGIDIKVAQVCAMELGIPLDRIRVTSPSTFKIAFGTTTGGSGTSENCCKAMGVACGIMKDRLKPFTNKGSWSEIVAAASAACVNLSCDGWWAPVSMEGTGFDYFVFGMALSTVEVNMLTGEHQILKTDILYDNGISLNPLVDVGQIEGALVQGIGYFFNEECVVDPESGRLMTDNTWDYKIPSSHDIPIELNVNLLANAPNPHGYFSTKATGEPPYALAVSIFLAVRNAVASARSDAGHDEHFTFNWPATVEKIQQASLVNSKDFTVNLREDATEKSEVVQTEQDFVSMVLDSF
eukprot:TRINITY_DN56_c0_g1_i4.p1 TRINITY_DN56_c0_g1~~TRINITY_DN56_c0_g1_i4.p1  ORF type:complete len:1465 (-),score=563.56 TRINITY_DN56_c0_g1_i4:265-4659(-)